MNRPYATLFMLMSVDGKISTGNTDNFDFDKDIPNIPYAREGLNQYYDLEKQGDAWSFITGRTLAKVGWNDKIVNPDLSAVSFVVYDNNHLTSAGISHLATSAHSVVIITSNQLHPVFRTVLAKVHGIKCSIGRLPEAFQILKEKYGCNSITIQSGGSFNQILFRQKLIDSLNIVVAPIIVGGKEVSTLVDGQPITDLSQITSLQFAGMQVLAHGYLNLKYTVAQN